MCFVGIAKKVKGCFKEVSRMFQESFKDVLRKINWCLEGV